MMVIMTMRLVSHQVSFRERQRRHGGEEEKKKNTAPPPLERNLYNYSGVQLRGDTKHLLVFEELLLFPLTNTSTVMRGSGEAASRGAENKAEQLA